MDICTEDTFVVTGLDDLCYMLVDSIEFVDFNFPLILKGELFQINEETGESGKIGRYNLQIDLSINELYPELQKEM